MDRISSFGVLSVVLLCALPLFVLFGIYATWKLNYWKRRGVEQLPNADLIFGNVKDAILFRTAPGWHMGKLHRAAKDDSPFVGLYIFYKPCLLLRDPEIIKQIFVRDFENFTDRHFAGRCQRDSVGMRNLFGLNNPAWKYLRRKITPAWTGGKLKQMFPFMTNVGENMMKYLKNQRVETNGTKIVDAQELNDKYTADLIASVALGTEMDSLNYPNAEFSKCFSDFFHGLKRMVALVTVFFMPELVGKLGSKVLLDMKVLRKIFWNAVEERERSGSKRGDFIDSLVQLKNGEHNPIYKFEGENLFSQSGQFFGFESSSTTTSFTLMELAKNKEIQERARKDVLRAVAEHGWSYEAMKDIKYVDQCIAETLRLHPPVSILDRFTKEEYRIPGTDVVLEKGTPIYISLFGLHGDPKFFDDPEVYNPERFRNGQPISDAYIPFGLGPRMCAAMNAGQLHVKVVLSMILKDYELYQRPEDSSYLDPRSTFTAAANGVVLHFRKLEA